MIVTSSILKLNQIRLYGYHGVSDEEQIVGSEFEIDISLKLQIDSTTLERDDINSLVNYAEVYQIAKLQFDIPSRTIENVALRIGKVLIEKFPMIDSVDIELAKNNPPMSAKCNSCSIKLTIKR